MIPSEAQEDLRPARLHPALAKEILHHAFAPNRRTECRASESIGFDFQRPHQMVSK
jgi:hypothetical protein